MHPYRTLRLAVKWAEFSRHACLIFQMKPTRCPLLRGIFISTSVHVSGNCVPIIRRTYCIYATPIFFTLYGWLSGLLVEMKHGLIPTSREVDRTAFLWFITQRVVVISYRTFGTTCRSHLRESGVIDLLQWDLYVVPKRRWEYTTTCCVIT